MKRCEKRLLIINLCFFKVTVYIVYVLYIYLCVYVVQDVTADATVDATVDVSADVDSRLLVPKEVTKGSEVRFGSLPAFQRHVMRLRSLSPP